MATLAALTEKYEHSVYDHIAREFGDVEVPMLAGRQSQGDVRVVPLAGAKGVSVNSDAKWIDVPAKGIAVVKPVGGGHTHTLIAEPGAATWTENVSDRESLAVGVVKVTGEAYLIHSEHGLAGCAPGEYTIRRQREQAEVQRLIAD